MERKITVSFKLGNRLEITAEAYSVCDLLEAMARIIDQIRISLRRDYVDRFKQLDKEEIKQLSRSKLVLEKNRR